MRVFSVTYRCNKGNDGQRVTVLKALPFLKSAKIEGKIGKDLAKARVKVKKEWDFPEIKIFLELLSLYIRCKEKIIALPEKTAKTLQDCLRTILEKVKEDDFSIDDLSEETKEAIINIREIKLVDDSKPDDEDDKYSLDPTSHRL